ncbi:MAG: flagellar assembly protein FliW [Vicinamibacterales bacterium]
MSMTVRNMDPEPPLRVTTRVGDFDVRPDELLSFPLGIPGFEQCRRFVLLSSAEVAPLQCLQAVDGPPASFLVVDPRLVLADYRCAVSETDRMRLQTDPDAPLLWLVVVTATADEPPYVNLRAPIVINPARMLGVQLMPSDTVYPMRFPLS